MATFDKETGERLDGPNGKNAKSPEPAPQPEQAPEDKPAKSTKKDS
jgi:hypothetical protein